MRGGADLIILETCFDSLNAKAAVYALEQLGDPFILSRQVKIPDQGLKPGGCGIVLRLLVVRNRVLRMRVSSPPDNVKLSFVQSADHAFEISGLRSGVHVSHALRVQMAYVQFFEYQAVSDHRIPYTVSEIGELQRVHREGFLFRHLLFKAKAQPIILLQQISLL